jgi:CRISPR-associated protein Cmr4
MNNQQMPCETLSFLALALDPIHVGTGGYRLGRVDMGIVREPGTNLPKIPGTSLSGACRSYAAMQVEDKYPRCAGQGGGGTGNSESAAGADQGHCGEPECPICVTFGFSKRNRSFQGLAQFTDAQLVLFPVHSLAGPVWVTCPDVLRNTVIANMDEPPEGTVRLSEGISTSGKLNLGWLMLSVDAALPSLPLPGIEASITGRVVLVSNRLFEQIVNDNLEVRTSVSIDPRTGAASAGALFTYEALPRGSVLAFEVIVTRPEFYSIKGQQPLAKDGVAAVRETVIKGLDLMALLGIGGMNTRGMGRLRVSLRTDAKEAS